MAMLEDYNAKKFQEVAVKEIYNKTMDQATDEEIMMARQYVFKRRLATLLFLGAHHGHYRIIKIIHDKIW